MSRATRSSTGWRVVFAYAGVCASTQVLWLTYAAITTESAKHYGVSVGAVGWLAEIFPLLYVVLALPAGMLLDRWFRPALAASGLLVAAGGLVRLGGDSYAWALAGQTLVALAQPLVLSAVSKLAGHYLPAGERPAGIAVGAAAGFVGMLVALLMGPTIGAHGQIERLLVRAGRDRRRHGARARGRDALARPPRPRARGDRGQRGTGVVGDADHARAVRARVRRVRDLRRPGHLAADAAAPLGDLRSGGGRACSSGWSSRVRSGAR